VTPTAPAERRQVLVVLGVILVAGVAVAAWSWAGITIQPNSAVATPSSEPSAAPTTSSPGPASPSSLPTPSPSPFPPLAAGVVPILYLHRVQPPPADWSTLTAGQRQAALAYDDIPAAFEAQLDWLQASGYTTILPRDLAAHWDRGVPLPPRPVILTFDDGDSSWTRTILPNLTRRGMVGEFYLTLTAIADHAITWAEVRELASAGMGIGAHDVHHVQLAMLGPTRPPASPTTMWFEVSEARAIIGREIGKLPDSMAYVGGGYDAELIALVKRAGYTTARSIIRGIVQNPADRDLLRVVAVALRDDVVDPVAAVLVPGLPTFAAKMAGGNP
jgi:peptidoglycan/xylan/chitin deacetylase (PgdA/CDA1 family)